MRERRQKTRRMESGQHITKVYEDVPVSRTHPHTANRAITWPAIAAAQSSKVGSEVTYKRRQKTKRALKQFTKQPTAKCKRSSNAERHIVWKQRRRFRHIQPYGEQLLRVAVFKAENFGGDAEQRTRGPGSLRAAGAATRTNLHA